MNVLYELEQGVRELTCPVHIIRAAYYFSNWDMALEEARVRQTLTSFFPEDFALPMVAPADLGTAAATYIAADDCDPGIHYVEGPRRYSSRDVADALGRVLNTAVSVCVIPESGWERTYRVVSRKWWKLEGGVISG